MSIGKGSVKSSYLVLEFFILALSYLSKYAIDGDLILKQNQFLEDPETRDENDFMTRAKNFNGGLAQKTLSKLIFGQSITVMIIALVFIATTFTIT